MKIVLLFLIVSVIEVSTLRKHHKKWNYYGDSYRHGSGSESNESNEKYPRSYHRGREYGSGAESNESNEKHYHHRGHQNHHHHHHRHNHGSHYDNPNQNHYDRSNEDGGYGYVKTTTTISPRPVYNSNHHGSTDSSDEINDPNLITNNDGYCCGNEISKTIKNVKSSKSSSTKSDESSHTVEIKFRH